MKRNIIVKIFIILIVCLIIYAGIDFCSCTYEGRPLIILKEETNKIKSSATNDGITGYYVTEIKKGLMFSTYKSYEEGVPSTGLVVVDIKLFNKIEIKKSRAE